MANIFDKWNEATKGLADELKEIEKNGGSNGDYEEIPFGNYVVEIEKMELKETKKTNDPMLSVWFKITDGDKKGSYIFMNQVVIKPFQMYIANEFLRSLDTEVEVDFNGNFKDYNDMILDIHEAIDKKCEFLLNYYDNKGYPAFKIEEVYDL